MDCKIYQIPSDGNDNSFIIYGSEKTAAMELPVEKMILPEYMERLKTVDYIIFTHTDPRYRFILDELLNYNKDLTIVATTAALRNYKQILNRDFKDIAAKNNMELSLGDISLTFTIAPYINQPDTMLAVSNNGDVFTGCLFSQYLDNTTLLEYYDDNIKSYELYAKKAVQTVKSLTPSVIYPSMGQVISHDTDKIIDLYEQHICSTEKSADNKKTAAIYYSSVYGFTKQMAETLYDELCKLNVSTRLFNADKDNFERMVKYLDSDILLFGSSTINRNASSSIRDLISRIDMINASNITTAVFGSYGWSGEAVRILETTLKGSGIKVFGSSQTAVYAPDADTFKALHEFAEKLVDSVINS